MRKFGFYPKLAMQNIRKNGKYYLPYLLTCIGASAMFYTMFFLSENDGINSMTGSTSVVLLLSLGSAVIGIFSTIILFYTNSFLMKRRKKELGLYNILGMEKRHIARFLFWETVYVAIIGIFGGLFVGILFSKLMLLLLCALMKSSVTFGFMISVNGMLWTAALFTVIFFLCLMYNLRNIGRAKPIELLYSSNEGDREPKTRLLLAVFGAVTLFAGYYMAITVKSPLSALGLFFVAVILVIIGTYCLFTAGSIAVLKALRHNKAYYYQTKHFIGISGMLHRMKRNAAGLASICILSTMVLVTVSTTLSLYLGTKEVLDEKYPNDIVVSMYDSDEASMTLMEDSVKTVMDDLGIEISNLRSACYYSDDSDIYLSTKEILDEYSPDTPVRATSQYSPLLAYVGFDLKNPTEVDVALEALLAELNSGKYSYISAYASENYSSRESVYLMMGGFLFIGIFLGALFLMATSLIIYYKQISEGYEDAGRFKIMQQVGMSEKDVHDSIKGQISTVFFLPLTAAALHIAAAFTMITKLLALFELTNVGLFAINCIGTTVVFAVIYAIIYSLTARAYYKIVKI